MTEEEIAALLEPDNEPAPRPPSARAMEELLAAAASLACEGRYERAMNAAKLADMIARASKRAAELENLPAEVGLGLSPSVFNLDQLGDQLRMNIAPAKAQLSALVMAAERGGDVVLCRSGRPVARIVPYADKTADESASALVSPV